MHVGKCKNKINRIVAFLVMTGILAMPIQAFSQTANDLDIQDLQQDIKSQRESIEALQDKIKAYERQIQAKQRESFTIKNQLSSLSDEIDRTKLELELKKQEIMQLNLQIKETEARIENKNKEIEAQKEKIAEFVRILYQNNQKSYIELLLSNDAFSEFFTQNRHLETLEGDLEMIRRKLDSVKEKLEIEKTELERQKKEMEEKRDALLGSQMKLEEKVTAKNVLLEATEADEAKFQQLLTQVRAEQAQINADIVRLEKALRAKLIAKGDKNLESLSGEGFVWPVPGRYITAGFHDPDYPFRRYFEHPAIDIRAKQGTPIQAIGSGYVSRAYDGGYGYSYISIIHADGLSSVYGHVSCILVKEDDYIVQGQVIGCTGATPGTPGAGRLTTGPHLHLEVRLNGIPVNPAQYLP